MNQNIVKTTKINLNDVCTSINKINTDAYVNGNFFIPDYASCLKDLNLKFSNMRDLVPQVEYISSEANNTVVVRWKDKTVTVVRCSEKDEPDLYSAFCAALAKKIYGSTSAVYREIDKHNVETINRKKVEEKQKAAEERKAREQINHDRKIRRMAKQMRDEAEAIELLNKPL